MLSPKCPAKLREAESLQEMASLITKRTRTAAEGDSTMHPAMNSDGTHHVMIGEQSVRQTKRATVSFSRRTGGTWTAKQQTTGDVISLLKNYSGLRVHEGELQSES